MKFILKKQSLFISILIFTIVIACGGDAESAIPVPDKIVKQVKNKIEKVPEKSKEQTQKTSPPKEEVKKETVKKAEKVKKVQKKELVVIEDLLEEKGIDVYYFIDNLTIDIVFVWQNYLFLITHFLISVENKFGVFYSY